MDPSLRNWGLASCNYDPSTGKLTVLDLQVIRPVLSTQKQVRQNSLDLSSGQQLYHGAESMVRNANITFAEVPVGSQSARSMASYGVCCGVLGALRATRKNFIEVSPQEVKLAGAGNKTATKQEMINWAKAKHPEAPWPMIKNKGQLVSNDSLAEHMADAIATVYAGIASDPFQQLLSLSKA